MSIRDFAVKRTATKALPLETAAFFNEAGENFYFCALLSAKYAFLQAEIRITGYYPCYTDFVYTIRYFAPLFCAEHISAFLQHGVCNAARIFAARAAVFNDNHECERQIFIARKADEYRIRRLVAADLCRT